ncbi:MAG: NAD-binding protein [Archangiaceae bacterium]|nr:NAD-binding protein [Archangiaceae bacterium]
MTVLDLDSNIVDILRRLGQQVHYGDASRLDLLTSAGCGKAKLFVLAVDEVDKSIEIGELVRRHFPNLPILARARNRTHYYRLLEAGRAPSHIFRETMGTSLEMAVRASPTWGCARTPRSAACCGGRSIDEAALAKMSEAVGTLSWMDLPARFSPRPRSRWRPSSRASPSLASTTPRGTTRA